MDFDKFKETEYIKCVEMLGKLFELDADIKERIHESLRSMGIKNFFLHLETMDFSPEISEKLECIKSVIEIFDEEGGQ